MQKSLPCPYWRGLLVVSLLICTACVVAAAYTRIWVLTAIPVGLLFGFFIQKGDLCGASAFSEVLLMKDWRKIFGLWVCIVVSMVGFAVISLLGWVQLSPKPLQWLNFLVGGLIFGAGTVLAGGCISGCLYKSATGNINSMAGLIGIATGVLVVEYGPLSPVHRYMMSLVVNHPDGAAVSLPTVTGLPFWALALIFAAATVFVTLIRSRGRHSKSSEEPRRPLAERLFFRPWKPWQAGLAMGLLAPLAYLSSAASGRNYPVGVTHGVEQVALLLVDRDVEHVWRSAPQPGSGSPQMLGPGSKQATQAQAGPTKKKVVWWLVGVVVSWFAGAWVSARLCGQARLLPKPPDETLIALFGGLLVGIGAGLATGCVIGNILSGWALMSVGTIIFGLATVLANWVATYFYLMGGSLFPARQT